MQLLTVDSVEKPSSKSHLVIGIGARHVSVWFWVLMVQEKIKAGWIHGRTVHHQQYPKDTQYVKQERSTLLMLWDVEKDTIPKLPTSETKYRQASWRGSYHHDHLLRGYGTKGSYSLLLNTVPYFQRLLSQKKVFLFLIFVCVCVCKSTCVCFNSHKRASLVLESKLRPSRRTPGSPNYTSMPLALQTAFLVVNRSDQPSRETVFGVKAW